MEQKRIHNLIILDESGSMQSIYNQALSGANETINTIRAAQKENGTMVQTLTFVTFDSGSQRPDVRAIIKSKPIDEVKDLTMEDYRPCGCTPLYDAMGISIKELSAEVREGDHVLVTVITDGMENSSRLYSSAMVKELVDGLRAKGWVFTYIGANQDSWEVAGGLGIHNAMDFAADEAGSRMMWEKANSSRIEHYRKLFVCEASGMYDGLEEDFFSQNRDESRVTPKHVEELKDNEILVLGSSDREGLDGNRYYIRTVGVRLGEIESGIYRFIRFADRNRDKRFLVTRVGCGHAGFDDEDIARSFAKAYSLRNVALPESFWKVLDYRFRRR